MRTEKLSDRLLARANHAAEVDPEMFRDMLETAELGWTPIEESGDYRWLLIRNFPVRDFNITMRDVIGEQEHEKAWNRRFPFKS